MASITIKLAGKDYEVAELTLGQIEELGVASVLAPASDPQEEMRNSFKRSLGILAAALAVQHPDMTVDSMRTLRITRTELREGVRAVLRHSGLELRDDAAPGEAPAGAA